MTKLDRTVLRLSGDGLYDWLSGLTTNHLNDDITFAALLTPQGKIIADFFVIKEANDLLIDTATKFVPDLVKRLSLYKLRAPITIEATDLAVYATWEGTSDEGYQDPRSAVLGRRIYGGDLTTEASPEDYDLYRMNCGIPDSTYDFDTSTVFPANANMDLLNGIDFKKGCFVGQEVVSRMHRKTDVKKRMGGFTFSGDLVETSMLQNDRVIGEVMHSTGGYGMAMIRLDRLVRSLAETTAPIMVGTSKIKLLDTPYGNQA